MQFLRHVVSGNHIVGFSRESDWACLVVDPNLFAGVRIIKIDTAGIKPHDE